MPKGVFPRPTLAERLWSKVEIRDGCWIWTGATDERYGSIWDGTRLVKAHRVAYELVVGPIPAGFEVDHLCSRTRCVRPAHLEAVTGLTNLKREHRRRAALLSSSYGTHTDHCHKGHAKTPENVRVSRGYHLCRTCERDRRARRAA